MCGVNEWSMVSSVFFPKWKAAFIDSFVSWWNHHERRLLFSKKSTILWQSPVSFIFPGFLPKTTCSQMKTCLTSSASPAELSLDSTRCSCPYTVYIIQSSAIHESKMHHFDFIKSSVTNALGRWKLADDEVGRTWSSKPLATDKWFTEEMVNLPGRPAGS